MRVCFALLAFFATCGFGWCFIFRKRRWESRSHTQPAAMVATVWNSAAPSPAEIAMSSFFSEVHTFSTSGFLPAHFHECLCQKLATWQPQPKALSQHQMWTSCTQCNQPTNFSHVCLAYFPSRPAKRKPIYLAQSQACPLRRSQTGTCSKQQPHL